MGIHSLHILANTRSRLPIQVTEAFGVASFKSFHVWTYETKSQLATRDLTNNGVPGTCSGNMTTFVSSGIFRDCLLWSAVGGIG